MVVATIGSCFGPYATQPAHAPQPRESLVMRIAGREARILVICLIVCFGTGILPTRGTAAQVATVRISWYKFPLADQLQLLANTYNQEHLGVRIVIDEVPVTQWYSNAFNQFASH